MASPEEPAAKRLDAPPLLGLVDDLLAVIFLRLPTLEDVGRAATVCSTFRRVIAARSFRRRLRSAHRVPCLGFVQDKFYPAEAPHPSAPYARALAGAADFFFSFLRAPGPWSIRDVRDGRVLLAKCLAARDLAVADPVSRRYVLLPQPPIPDDLAAPDLQLPQSRLHLESLLVPASDDEDPASFRVICMAVRRARLVAFVFSSSSGEWGAFPFQGWSAFAGNAGAQIFFSNSWRYWVDGFLYWRVAWMTQLLVLDMGRMEFSFAKIPLGSLPEYYSAIAEADDGSPELFAIRKAGGKLQDLYSNRHTGANSWQSRKKVEIQLPSHDGLLIAGAAERYLLLQKQKSGGCGSRRHRAPPIIAFEYLLLDLEVMQLEKVCELKDWFLHVNLYTGFPPSLSHPSV